MRRKEGRRMAPIVKGFIQRFVPLFLLLLLLLGGSIPTKAEAAVSVRASLTDGSVQRGRKRTVEVWARDGAGRKIASRLTLNGKEMPSAWEDEEKASYVLAFDREGENIVIVSAGAGGQAVSATYRLQYRKARQGEVIGQAVVAVELFTIGCGYLVEPAFTDIREGENGAELLLRVLHDSGYAAYYGGTPRSSFYLGYIADGDKTAPRFNAYTLSGTGGVGRPLALTPAIPPLLVPNLQRDMSFYDPLDYEKNWAGTVGEFVFTDQSGWMYAVNGRFPNVSLSDCYLSDGDVMRMQFTLACGADIGGSGALRGGLSADYYPAADKEGLTAALARATAVARAGGSGRLEEPRLAAAYSAAVAAAQKLDLTQREADAAREDLEAALSASGEPTVMPPLSRTTGEPTGAPKTSAAGEPVTGTTDSLSTGETTAAGTTETGRVTEDAVGPESGAAGTLMTGATPAAAEDAGLKAKPTAAGTGVCMTALALLAAFMIVRVIQGKRED